MYYRSFNYAIAVRFAVSLYIFVSQYLVVVSPLFRYVSYLKVFIFILVIYVFGFIKIC